MNYHPSDKGGLDRRGFLKTSGTALGVAGIAGLAFASTSAASASSRSSRIRIAKGDVILFQGDSITDAGRDKDAGTAALPNNHAALGHGYAWLAGVELLVDRPKDGLKIFNRGISGNKVFQLADRWQADCLDLKPDLLSILIGVNDYWHTIDPRVGYKGTVGIYERDFRALIERTKKALPKVKLVICEPFVLRYGAVTDKWFPEFDRYRAAAKRVAKDFHTTFVPFQAMFDEAVKYAPPAQWVADGVHPSPTGAALMAHFWQMVVSGGR